MLRVVVDTCFPLADAAKAHQAGIAGHAPGKYYSRGFTLSGRPGGLSSNPGVVPGYVQ